MKHWAEHTERLIHTRDDRIPLNHVSFCFEGSPAFDPPGKEGLTCLTNRMLIEGVKTLDRNAFHRQVESLGTEVLTATDYNYVSVGGTILDRHRDEFIGLLRQALISPAFNPREFERVRREMLSELELMRDEDGHLARFWLRQKVFGEGPQANHALGTAQGLQGIILDDVRNAHRVNYCRRRLWVGVSGNAKREHVESELAGWTDDLPLGEPVDWAIHQSTESKGRRVLLIDKPQRTQAQILLGHPCLKTSHPDEWPLRIATSAFGGSFTSRLVQEIRVNRAASYDAYAHMSSERLGGLYVLGASADAKRMVETVDALLHEYEKFVDDGLSDDEIEFARDSRAKSFPFTIETATLEMSQRLRGCLAGRSPGWLKTYMTYLLDLNPQSVRDAVRRHLTPRNLWIVVVCTVDTQLVDRFKALADIESVDVIPYDAQSGSDG